jgi:hypothetical protein
MIRRTWAASSFSSSRRSKKGEDGTLRIEDASIWGIPQIHAVAELVCAAEFAEDFRHILPTRSRNQGFRLCFTSPRQEKLKNKIPEPFHTF